MVVTTLSNITFSWIVPSNDNGVILQYVIQFTKDGIPTTKLMTESIFVLEDLAPSTEVQFSASAISICELVGEPSSVTESTDAIRKYIYTVF